MTTVKQLKEMLASAPDEAIVVLTINDDKHADEDMSFSMVCSGDIAVDESGYQSGECIIFGEDDR